MDAYAYGDYLDDEYTIADLGDSRIVITVSRVKPAVTKDFRRDSNRFCMNTRRHARTCRAWKHEAVRRLRRFNRLLARNLGDDTGIRVPMPVTGYDIC